MKLKLIEKKQEITDVVSFIFQTDIPVSWTAGQFIHITIPHDNADSRGIDRYFTISSSPEEGHVMITTRFSSPGSTFKQTLSSLPIGAEIESEMPEGDFVFEEIDSQHVFIAGGMGITPYRSMLVDLDKKNVPINCTLLYANRDQNFVFKEELANIAARHPEFRIRYVAADERIDENLIRSEIPDIATPLFYVSGPEPMTEAFEKSLPAMGIPETHTRRDYFPGYLWP